MARLGESDAMPDWCRATAAGLLLEVHVQPNARKTEAAGEYDGALKIRLQAPPVDGRANEALIAWIARTLALPRQQVVLKSGQTSRRKSLQLTAPDLDAAAVAARLLAER
jgi:uncharacterized protein